MSTVTVLQVILVALSIVHLSVARSARRPRQAPPPGVWRVSPAQAVYPPPQNMAAFPAAPYQRFAFVPVDAFGRPQQYPVMNMLPPKQIVYPPRPAVRPQYVPPAPRRVLHRPPQPAAPPVPPAEVLVIDPPECGTYTERGKCCKEAFKCPENHRIDDERMACAAKSLGAVCCVPTICD